MGKGGACVAQERTSHNIVQCSSRTERRRGVSANEGQGVVGSRYRRKLL